MLDQTEMDLDPCAVPPSHTGIHSIPYASLCCAAARATSHHTSVTHRPSISVCGVCHITDAYTSEPRVCPSSSAYHIIRPHNIVRVGRRARRSTPPLVRTPISNPRQCDARGASAISLARASKHRRHRLPASRLAHVAVRRESPRMRTPAFATAPTYAHPPATRNALLSALRGRSITTRPAHITSPHLTSAHNRTHHAHNRTWGTDHSPVCHHISSSSSRAPLSYHRPPRPGCVPTLTTRHVSHTHTSHISQITPPHITHHTSHPHRSALLVVVIVDWRHQRAFGYGRA